MNQPFNPVLTDKIKPTKPWADPTTEKPTASGKKTDRMMTRLSNPENFALIEWLKAYKQKPDDTIHTIARKAADELRNQKINYNHVQQRMVEFGIPAPNRGGVAADAAERIAKLEQQLREVVRSQIELCRKIGVDPANELIELYMGHAG